MARIAERSEKLAGEFERIYGEAPSMIVKGPGRVDLLGSHTDYNEGFVLPVAINMEVLAAGSLNEGNLIRLYSANFEASSEFPWNDIAYDETHKWSNYVRGVVKYLAEMGVIFVGADVALEGDVPIASGLSSSAALEMAVASLFQNLLRFQISASDIALIGQSAENRFVGVNTGIMDQFISRLGKKDHALFLDCRTLEYEHVPLETENIKLVVCDTMKRRGLVDSEYNTRRAQCEEAAKVFGVTALRDVNPEMFESRKNELSEVVRMRAKHVIYENERVLESRNVLQAGDLAAFARLMNESHDSARDYYEVSCPELDAMTDTARSAPGCLSARMAGAGFGGCIVSLVETSLVSDFLSHTEDSYKKQTGISPTLYVCTAEDGAGVVDWGEIDE